MTALRKFIFEKRRAEHSDSGCRVDTEAYLTDVVRRGHRASTPLCCSTDHGKCAFLRRTMRHTRSGAKLCLVFARYGPICSGRRSSSASTADRQLCQSTGRRTKRSLTGISKSACAQRAVQQIRRRESTPIPRSWLLLGVSRVLSGAESRFSRKDLCGATRHFSQQRR